MSTIASSRVTGISQALIVLAAGFGLAFLAARSSPLFLLAAVLGVMFLFFFIRRPDLGLLTVLVVRASSDVVVLLLATGDPTSLGGLRGLIMNPNTALILILIGAGILTILARPLPIMSLPGGVLLVVLAVTGLVGIIRSDRLLFSFQEWVPMLAAPVTYALAAGTLADPAKRLWVPKALAASFMLPALVGYLQLWTGGGRFITGFVRIFGTFVHPNPFGLYLVIILAVFVPLAFLRSRTGVVARIIAAAASPLLVATLARFAWAGAMIVLVSIGFLRHRILLLLIPLVGFMALIPTVQMRLEDPLSGSFADRLNLWRNIYEQWTVEVGRDGTTASAVVSILGGLGPGGASLLGEQFGRGTFAAHNDYIRLLVEYGAVGLIVYVAVTLTMIRLAYQAFRASRDRPSGTIALSFLALAIAYPIMSLTSNIVAATYNQLYFWTLAGLCVSLRAEAQETQRAVPSAEAVSPVWQSRLPAARRR